VVKRAARKVINMDNLKEQFVQEEQDALGRLNTAISKVEEGNKEAICDIKHSIGCVVRMLHLFNQVGK
jgi:Na+-transporting NADH:ubiquinone oxidoreductase subunit NqrA